MSLIALPEGVELDLKVYVVGMVGSVETEVMITLGGLPAFADDIKETVELTRIVKSQGLDELGTGWRVMSRAEITDYKQRQREAEDD